MYKTDIPKKEKRKSISACLQTYRVTLLSQHIKICEVIFPKRKATTILRTKEISLTSARGRTTKREGETLSGFLFGLDSFPSFPMVTLARERKREKERERENWSQMKVQSKRDTLGLIFPLYPFLLLFSVQFECLREKIGPHT